MNSTTTYPDGLDRLALNAIEQQVSEEIAPVTAPTMALLDGTARERRNRRMAARALAGITTKYGITLREAHEDKPVRHAATATVAATRSARRTVRAEAA